MASTATPSKESDVGSSRSKTKMTENSNPNLSNSGSKSAGSKGQKCGSRTKAYSPRNKLRERKFVVAKKKSKEKEKEKEVKCKCKCNAKKKCLCVAYESLRTSQEEFLEEAAGGEDELEKNFMIQLQIEDESGNDGDKDEMSIKRRRDKVLEEGVPEPGSGRVKFLIKAFEQSHKLTNNASWKSWGLDQAPKEESQTRVSTSSFCPSDLFLTSENLGFHNQDSLSTSWDSSRGSISSKNSNAGSRRNRTSSTESSLAGATRRWKKKQHARVTSLKPFRLRTELRGRIKEEEFMKKVQEMTIEEQKQRIPIAQGLPWTTDEPECLVKPPVKEITKPLDPILHSDVRAVERAEFDHQVAEKMNLIEQYRMERERQQKLAEEEEIKRLRKELVPKAQPMPYFDRPFIPRRSEKQPTMPKEPKFHLPQNKKIKCYVPWNDVSSYTCSE